MLINVVISFPGLSGLIPGLNQDSVWTEYPPIMMCLQSCCLAPPEHSADQSAEVVISCSGTHMRDWSTHSCSNVDWGSTTEK